jgi:hypothetical protein
MAFGLLLVCSASAVQAAGEVYNEIDAPLFVCSSQAQAFKLAHLGLDEDKMRDFTFSDNSGCSQWKNPAKYRLSLETAANGIVQIQIDKDNRVGNDQGLGWTTQQQIYRAIGKTTDLVVLPKPALGCNTLVGAKENIPTSMRAASAGIVVLGASDGTKAHPTQNYACSRIEQGTYAIGFRDSLNSGLVKYKLMDAKNTDVWMINFWK